MINRRQGRYHLPTILVYVSLVLASALFLHTLLVLPSLSSSILLDDSGKQQHCHLPNLNPWDQSIMPYVFKMSPLVCPPASDAIAIEQDPETGDLLLLKSANKAANLTCQYRKIGRGHDDHSLTYSDPYQITAFPFSAWPQDAEFFQVSCSTDKPVGGSVVYSDIFTKMSPFYSISEQRKRAAEEAWNVLIIGIDSISQLNFVRSLPKSLEKLKTLGAVIMKGYNKVGENTFPNLVALLTGHRVELLPGERLPSQLPHDGSNGETFDDYPFIWKDFKKQGYATLFAEDMPRIGTFNWEKSGFRNQPTDHFGRTLFIAMDKLHPYVSILNPILQLFESKSIHLTASPSLCFQGRKKHMMFWNYAVRQFLNAYLRPPAADLPVPPFFGLTWLGEPSHDHVNMISVCDDDLASLIDWLPTGALNNRTFVFIIADHGARFDNIRNTLVGRVEDRMPFFSALLPTAFKAKYPQLVDNLRANADRLTTPLDFHQTMQHILHLSSSSNRHNNKKFSRLYPDNNPKRWSASLLSEVLPETRTCWQANIPEHYCACYRETPVHDPNTDKAVSDAGRFIVEHVNADLATKYQPPEVNLTAGTKCARLEFAGIESASRLGATKSVINDVQPAKYGAWLQPGRQMRNSKADDKDEYMIVARAQPSGALFEAHVDKAHGASGKWTILGEVQRINAYGNTSWCVSGSSAAKKFCHCTGRT